MATQPVTLHPDDVANMPDQVSSAVVDSTASTTPAQTAPSSTSTGDQALAPSSQVTNATPTPITSAVQVDPNDIPAFEQNAYKNAKIVDASSGIFHDSTAIAHTLPVGNRVYIDDPKSMDPAIVPHELLHLIQKGHGVERTNPDAPDAYDYGDQSGLEEMRKTGKTISSLDNEKQAAVLTDYLREKRSLETRLNSTQDKDIQKDILNQYDALNKTYGPFIHQEANMAGKTIDTTPQPPGPPPSALTGAMKPIPEIGGKTVNQPIEMEANAVHNPPPAKTAPAKAEPSKQTTKPVEKKPSTSSSKKVYNSTKSALGGSS